MRQVLDSPEVVKRLHLLGNYPDTAALGTSEALVQFIRDDSALMARILKEANLLPEDAAK
jgi:tripartite-type tricarboxylate transporter receptor subunit TctC